MTDSQTEQTQISLNPDRVLELLELDDHDSLKRELQEYHPADIALTLAQLPHELRVEIISLLESNIVAKVIAELDEQDQARLIKYMPTSEVAEIVKELQSNDAADLLSTAKDEQAAAVLDHLDIDERCEITELMAYDEESAGGIMAKEALSVLMDTSVEDVIALLRSKASEIGDIYHIYVVDKTNVLVGYLSLKRLILAEPDQLIGEVMKEYDVSVNVNLDREEVAVIFSKYDLASAPVVDDRGKFLGRITHDDILDVISDEAEEDLARLTGQAEFDPGERSLLRNLRLRLPWLILGLLGGLGAARVIAFFEPQLASLTALVFYLPLVAAMGGNAGIQTSSLMVRGLATGEIGNYGMKKRLLAESGVALLTGLICASILFLVTLSWQDNITLATVVAASLMSVVFLGAVIGIIVPLILKKLNLDPALATGPFITTANDIVGLLIYLGIATIFITKF